MLMRILLVALFAAVSIGGCGKKPEAGSAQGQAAQSGIPEHRGIKKMSVEEARKKAPFKVLAPAYLPEGVRYLETRYIEYGADTFVVLQYEYTGKQRYFQVDEYPPTVAEVKMPGVEEIQIGSFKGQAQFQHGFSMVRWTQDGTRLMINGAIGQAEAMKVAQSFK